MLAAPPVHPTTSTGTRGPKVSPATAARDEYHVPKPAKGRPTVITSGHGHDHGHVYDNDPLRLSRD